MLFRRINISVFKLKIDGASWRVLARMARWRVWRAMARMARWRVRRVGALARMARHLVNSSRTER